MIRSQRGFTAIEMLVSLAIATVLGGTATMTALQIVNGAAASQATMAVSAETQRAGYVIGRDVLAAESIVTDGLTPPTFLVLTWTEQDYGGGDPVYHSATYSFRNLVGGVGELVRNRWSSAGLDGDTIVARYLRYDPDNPGVSSNASYFDPVLSVTLRAASGDVSQARTYVYDRRTDFAP